MLPHRSLLYHRGIDDHVGTYVTDYVIFVTCSIYAAVLAWRSWRCRHIPDVVLKSTYTVVSLLTIMSLVALIGGLSHQFLQEVEPYESWHDNWTWLIVWRFGTSLSTGIIFSLFVLGYSLLEQEDVAARLSKRSCVIAFYVIISTICAAVFVESWWRISSPTDPWTVRITFMAMFASAAVELVCALIAACKSGKNQTLTLHEKDIPSTSLTKSTDCPNNNSKPSTVITSAFRIDLILHVIAPILFLIGGISQFVLGKMGCADNDDAYSHGCPLPNNFNHNVILHLVHVISLTIYFSAEMLAIKRRLLLNKCNAGDVLFDSLLQKRDVNDLI